MKEYDGNVYVRQGSSGPLVVWGPVANESCSSELASLDDLKKAGFEAHGTALTGYAGAVFKSPELSRYELARPLPGVSAAVPLPAPVRQMLGWGEGETLAPGAYPLRGEAKAAKAAGGKAAAREARR